MRRPRGATPASGNAYGWLKPTEKEVVAARMSLRPITTMNSLSSSALLSVPG
jgi:hypothetical protein